MYGLDSISLIATIKSVLFDKMVLNQLFSLHTSFKMTEYLFSYGTLQKDRVQLETFGRLLKGAADVLAGYVLSTVEITDPEVLAASEQQYHLIAIYTGSDNDKIEGVIFEITSSELLAADGYEADDYKRVKEKFRSGNEAWVYVKAG